MVVVSRNTLLYEELWNRKTGFESCSRFHIECTYCDRLWVGVPQETVTNIVNYFVVGNSSEERGKETRKIRTAEDERFGVEKQTGFSGFIIGIQRNVLRATDRWRYKRRSRHVYVRGKNTKLTEVRLTVAQLGKLIATHELSTGPRYNYFRYYVDNLRAGTLPRDTSNYFDYSSLQTGNFRTTINDRFERRRKKFTKNCRTCSARRYKRPPSTISINWNI